MKPNFIDKVIGFVNPEAGTRRMQSRMKQDLILRGYDAAKDFRTSDWTSAAKTSANEEVKAAQKKIRERSRDLGRNNPYAVRAFNVITANTVGAGIVANISVPGNDPKTEELRILWKLWSESTACDAAKRSNFYGMQAQIMRSTAESGEGLAVRTGLIPDTGPVIRVLESDYINSDDDKPENGTVQGIGFDSKGLRSKYMLFATHPGDKGATGSVKAIPAADVAHVYRQDRPGQVRGMPWTASIIEALKDFDDYQRATLIGRKIAACFAAFITTNGSDSGLSAADLKTKREAEMSLNPAQVRYLDGGESIQFATPPAVSGYAEFTRESLRAVAAGLGVSYEALTGDYSQSNYSSSRMGHLEFRRNIEDWRWNMLIPQFCEPTFTWFKEWACVVAGVDPLLVTVEWVPPAYEMIDPTKDISAIRYAIRSGLLTLPQAIRAQGYDPDTQLKEIQATNLKLDAMEIALDVDPRKMSQIGFAQAGESLGILADVKAPPTPEGTPTSEQKNNEGSAVPDTGSGN